MRKSLWLSSFLVLCLWGGPLAAQPTVESYDAPFMDYPTYTVTSTSFTVEDSAVIADLAIQINIECPYALYVAGLRVNSPEGTSINLTYYQGGYGSNIDCVYSDLGKTVAQFNYSGTTGSPSELDIAGDLVKPATGSGSFYTPGTVTSLSTGFDDELCEGEWTLDVYGFYGGTVQLWGVQVYTVDHVDNLTCSAGDELGDVTLSWNNPSTSDLDGVDVWHGGDIIASLGAGDIDLSAGASNSIDAGTFPVPQQAEFRVVAIVGGENSQAAICVQSLMNDATATVTESPAYSFGGSTEPLYVGLLEFAEPSTTIGDIIVDVDISHGFLPYMEVYVGSWSGTTVGLFDPDGSSSGTIPGGLVASFWDLGATHGSVAWDAGLAIKPSGPGSLTEFVGQETIDSGTGEATWAIVVSDSFGYYMGTVNSVGIRIFDAAGGATPAPTGVSCDVAAGFGAMVASWTNGGDYESVVIYVDGSVAEVLDGPFFSGSTGSFEYTSDSVPDEVSVHIQGQSSTGQYSKKVGCSTVLVVDAPTSLSCISETSGVVDLSWINPADGYFADIIINVDGDDVDTIGGDSTSWTSTDAGLSFDVPSVHSFSVRGAVGASQSARISCTLMLLEPPELEVCASEDTPFGYVEISSDVTVDDVGTAENVELTLSLTDGGIYYARWMLDAPSGTSVELHKQYTASYFTGAEVLMLLADGGESFSSLSHPDGYGAGNTVQPDQDLSTLVGEGIDGTWTLRTLNNGYGQTFHNWCLRLDFCSVLPPTDLACTTSGTDVDLEWLLGDSYDSIDIYVDDAVFDTVDGDAEVYTVSGLEVGRHNFRVTGISTAEGCSAPSARCNASVGFTEICVSEPATVYPASFTDIGIEFPDPIIVGEVEVVFDLTSGFGYTSYYKVQLTSPYGTNVLLHNQQYYPGGFELIWSDEGGTAAGSYECGFCLIEPSPGNLSDFVGEIADGEWELSIYGSGDTGTLDLGCIAIYEGCTATPPADLVCENVAGTKDIALEWINGDDYSEVRIKRNGDVVAVLDGSAESYTDEGLISDFYTYQAVGYTASLDCESGSRFCKTSVGITEICNSTDVADTFSGTPVESTVEVTDDIAIDEVRARVDATTFYVYNYSVSLEGPSGTEIQMYKSYYGGGGLPGSYSNFNCTFANDGASTPPSSFDCDGCLIDSTSSLEPFADESPVGTWTLRITPFYSGYGLTLNEWCLQLMVGCPIGRPVITGCAAEEGLPPVIVTWENNDSYDSIEISRDGAIIATLGGDETEYADGDLAEGGFHDYRILGVSSDLDCSKPSGTCTVGVGLISKCSAPYSVLNNVSKLDFLDWQSPAMDEAVDCFKEAGETFDPSIVEAQVRVNVDMSLYAYYVDLQLFAPDNTTVVLKDGYSTIADGPDILVTFSDKGVTLSTSSDQCECLVMPTGPGSMGDFAGQDPRGEWLMVSESWYPSYAGYLNEWCVEVFLDQLPICPDVVDEGPWFRRGDCNNNGSFNALSDALYLLQYGFSGGATPTCLTACDSNNNNNVNALSDALHMLQYGFSGGSAPPSPGPTTCGADPETPTTGGTPGCATESTSCNAAH